MRAFKYVKIAGSLLLVIINASIYAQQFTPIALREQFLAYQKNAFQEKIYVHTDKTVYLAGEVMWYKVYNVDGYVHKPLDLEKITYVEIIGRDQKAILQAKIAMSAGSGNGFFAIPPFLPSGQYLLRAYTNYMKNFAPDFYFEQLVTIINTLNSTIVADTVARKKYAIQFFPEGGDLVMGLTTKIGFKVTDQEGKGVPCRGSIVNSMKDTVARFTTFHAGMGHFELTTKGNEIYTAVVCIEDVTITQVLPAIKDKGYALRVIRGGEEQVEIAVTATYTNGDQPVYLFIQSNNLVKDILEQKLINGKATFIIPQQDLTDGISQFTLFDEYRKPVCERLYFKRPGHMLQMTVKTGRSVYKVREKVDIGLQISDSMPAALMANLSMSVFMTDSIQKPPSENIFTYLLMTSDLKGKIEDPGFYFAADDATAFEAVDNLMLTQGWRRFNWKSVLEDTKPVFAFLPELEGPQVSAKITTKGGSGSIPPEGVVGYISNPSADFEMESAACKPNGDIIFTLKDFRGHNELILQSNYREGNAFRIDINNPYSDKFSSTSFPALDITLTNKNDLAKRNIGVQIENTYRTDKKRIFLPSPSADSFSFYGRPDRNYYLDEYTRFVTMEEVMREFVDNVRIRKESGKFHFHVVNALFKTYFDNDPMVLVDGVPVADADKVMALDPLKIKNIEVVSHRYYLGSTMMDGIVHFKTYNGDLAGYQLDPNAVVIEYDGLQQLREFYSPGYETQEQETSRLPDFRNVLSWKPDIKTDEHGTIKTSFYTSDIKGTFRVFIQGISSNGLPIAASTTFEVEK
ncbi:MAG TPA: hypothetical protein VF939_02830 [Puia sp.]